MVDIEDEDRAWEQAQSDYAFDKEWDLVRALRDDKEFMDECKRRQMAMVEAEEKIKNGEDPF